ncbi:MAG: MBL fold metallo-hydrolase [Saprospiraceae bacterium]|nr:MBL fold metallo-hydrolase [Saprospiraceae bacterium]
MKIKFNGAAKMVTGSCHLVTLDDGYKILLDCGLFQGNGKRDWDLNNKFDFNPSDVDVVILSHAHIDHSGRLPKLVKDGYSGQIFCTHATRSLCNIMLLDSAKIQERDVEFYNKNTLEKKKKDKFKYKDLTVREPLYTTPDIPPVMSKFVGCPYDSWVQINDELEVLFRDAGHILGSASVTLKIKKYGKETLLGFTGDIGRPNRPIIKDPVPMMNVDYLITESTYGNRIHEPDPEQAENLLRVIRHTCIDKRGKLIIPAFSVERTQEIIYMLDKLSNSGKLPERIPIYVDSPLAINATMVFASHPECFDSEIHEYMLLDDNPFGFNNLHYTKTVEGSKQLNNMKQPMVIISASGMMNAGRVKHHLFNNIEDKNATFLLISYCGVQTPGAILKSGATEIKLFGEVKKIKAEIVTMESFSGHGDKNEMLDFIINQKDSARRTFIVHGDYEVQLDFKKLLEDNGFSNIYIPDFNEEVTI